MAVQFQPPHQANALRSQIDNMAKASLTLSAFGVGRILQRRFPVPNRVCIRSKHYGLTTCGERCGFFASAMAQTGARPDWRTRSFRDTIKEPKGSEIDLRCGGDIYAHASDAILSNGSAKCQRRIRKEPSLFRWYAGRIREGYCPHPRHWQGFGANGRCRTCSIEMPKFTNPPRTIDSRR